MSEKEAHAVFVKVRFLDNGGAPYCVRCGHKEVYTIERELASKATGEVYRRTIYRCKACRRQFSATTGTAFASHKLSFVDILFTIGLFTNGAKGMSALQMSRHVQVDYKTAFVLLHKVREGLFDSQRVQMLAGTVEIDATYVGGFTKQSNRVVDRIDRRRLNTTAGKKQSLVLYREKGPGGRSVPFVGSEIEAVAAIDQFVAPDAEIHADEAVAYNPLHAKRRVKRIDHSKEFARNGVSTNAVESAWARFKRSRKGVYHRIAGAHVGAYLGEISWREDNRLVPAEDQFTALLAAGLHHPVSRKWKGYWQRRKAEAA